MGSTFKRLLLPGLVFQSICIAGGYGTGRELVAFFLQFGPVGGLLGLLVPSMLVISIGCAIAYELARMTRSYDYRKFLQVFLGRGWFLYEIVYFFSIIVVLAVVTAAIGSLMSETFGIPDTFASIGLLLAIAFLVFKGTEVIEGVMSVWSFVLYFVFVSIFVASMIAFGDRLSDGFATTADSSGWFFSAFRYGSFSVALVPAILFATTHIETRKDAIFAGLLTGPIYTVPAVLFFIAMVPHYPAIVDRPVPINYILEILDLRWLQVAFAVMLVGTFVETGSGMIHAVNERIAGVLESTGRHLSGRNRALIAVGLLTTALLMSRFGIIDLIAVGYDALAWSYMIILVLPLFTIGAWMAIKNNSGEKEKRVP